jgi:hypothetical protein
MVGIYFDRTLHVADQRSSKWWSYAVIVVQQVSGKVVIVVAGLTGAATQGAIHELQNLTCDLRKIAGDEKPVTYWAVIGVEVEDKSPRPEAKFRADDRHVVQCRIVKPLSPFELHPLALGDPRGDG